MSYYQNRRNMPIGPPQALPLRRTVPVNGLGAYYANRRNMPIGPRQALPLRSMSGLGQACPPCTIWNGAACVPCPPGAEGIPECEGCENGQLVEAEPGFFERSAFWGPVLIGTITALTSAVALGYVLGQR